MSPRRTSSETSRRRSKRPKPTKTTSSRKKPRSSTAPRRSATKKSTDTGHSSHRVYIGLGSNLDDPRTRISDALARLRRLAPVLRVSSIYRTAPVGHLDQPDFCNAAAAIRWDGSPESLLDALKEIERAMGRIPRFRNGPREIDLDILDFGGVTREDADPILPHPRLASRRFALAPLAEIAPRWTHPATGKKVGELLAALPAAPFVRRWK